MKTKLKPKVMHCGAHKVIYGPPLDVKVREEKDNLQCDKGRDIRDNPEGANRGNCGVMGVNFEESLLKERVEKANKRMPDGQISTSSSDKCNIDRKFSNS